jgi:hypothetical protein
MTANRRKKNTLVEGVNDIVTPPLMASIHVNQMMTISNNLRFLPVTYRIFQSLTAFHSGQHRFLVTNTAFQSLTPLSSR